MTDDILIFAEQRDNRLHPAALQIVTAARQLADKTGGQVIACVIGDDIGNAAAAVNVAGVDKIVTVTDPSLGSYSTLRYRSALCGVIDSIKPRIVLMLATSMGRDLSPRVAARIGGGCGGDTWSLLNADTPDMIELLSTFDIDLLWHQSLSVMPVKDLEECNQRILSGEQALDILCVEGSVIQGPDGTGLFDTRAGKAKKDIIEGLARKARYVVAVGTCASFGGIGAESVIMATGLQFTQWSRAACWVPIFNPKQVSR